MIKFGMFLDKTKVKSYYSQNQKVFNYFTKEPYIREHSISNECQMGFWSYPVMFDGKMLNLNEFDNLPDEEFDLIFLNLESSTPKFDFDKIKQKYNCKIFGIFKELWDVNSLVQYNAFSKCDKIITGVFHQVGLLEQIYGNKVHYIPQPVNVDFLRKKYYVQTKENYIFCYLTADQRCIYNLNFSNYISQKYQIPMKYNDPKNKLNWGDFLKYFGNAKYQLNLDTESLSVGQQSCQCAALGVINLGGNNDATYNLYPETYGLDFVKIENFLKYLLNENNRVEYENLVLERLKCIYDYEIVKNKIYNLL